MTVAATGDCCGGLSYALRTGAAAVTRYALVRQQLCVTPWCGSSYALRPGVAAITRYALWCHGGASYTLRSDVPDVSYALRFGFPGCRLRVTL